MNKRLLSLLVIAIFVMVNAVGAFAASSERINEKFGTPDFITGDLTAPSTDAPEAIATKYLENNKAKLKVNGAFAVKEKSINPEGETVVKVQQTYNGYDVFGYQQKVLVGKDGAVKSFSGLAIPELDKQAKLKVAPKVLAADAIKTAQADIKATPIYAKEPSATLVVYFKDDVASLAYHVSLTSYSPSPIDMQYFVDATTGTVIDKYDNIQYVSGTNVTCPGIGVLGGARTINCVYSSGYYYTQDNTRGYGIWNYNTKNSTSVPGSLHYNTSGNFNTWTDHAVVDASYYTAKTYDYFYATFGRNGYDRSGSMPDTVSHYGVRYNNAFSNGPYIVFGDGDGTTFVELSGALDVIAHEFTHSMSGYEANFTYSGQSGAISESYSDIFGTLVEYWANISPDWLMGEDIYTPGTSGDALRSMANPHLYGDPDHYSERYTGTSDYGGVHTNSGIVNKCAYLMANGGTSHSVTVTTGIGTSKVGAIFYKALIDSCVASETWSQLRAQCITAATSLYGSTSTEVNTVKQAFSAVGIN